MTWLTLILFLIILSLIWHFYYNIYNYWTRRGIPNERPLPLLGNMSGIGTRYHLRDICQRLYNRFKGETPLVGMFMFLTRTVLLLDVELVKQVLIKDFSNFHDRGLYNNVEDDPLTGHLLMLEGEQWRALRNKLTPVFTSGKIKQTFPVVVEVAECLVLAIKNALPMNSTIAELEIKEFCACYTTDVIGTVAFGLECNSLQNADSEFRAKGRLLFEKPRHNQVIQNFIQTNPVWSRKLHLKFLRDDLSEFFIDAVRHTIDYRLKNNIKRNDFLDMMIELRALEDFDVKKPKQYRGIDLEQGLTLLQIAAQAFVFFVAGFETSSSTMGFCLYELALHPEIQTRLRQEIEDVLKQHNNELSYEAMMEMHYLEQVLAETLRKHPIISLLLRKTIADYPVLNTTHVIPKGTTVLVPVHAIHHDPELYPEPERFDPARFEAAAINARPNCAYLPFGEGQRNCIGLRFGKMQAKIGLIALLRNYKFSVSKRTEIPLIFNKRTPVLAAQNGIKLNVEKII